MSQPSPEIALRLAVAEREAGLHLAAFHEAPVPLVIVEQDGTVRSVNAATSRLFDTTLGAATGRPAWTLLGAQNRAVLEEATRCSTFDHDRGQWPIDLDTGRAWLVCAPLGGGDDEAVGLLAVLAGPVSALPPGVPDASPDADEGSPR